MVWFGNTYKRYKLPLSDLIECLISEGAKRRGRPVKFLGEAVRKRHVNMWSNWEHHIEEVEWKKGTDKINPQ